MRFRQTVLGFLAAAFIAAPASAQVVHSIHFGGGYFWPRGLDSRVDGDVLVRDLLGEELPGYPGLSDALVFQIGDFGSGHVFGEWNIGFGDHVEIGAGVSLYGQTVHTVYRDLVDEEGFNIPLALKLRVTPVTGVVRFLPFGRAGDVQPYLGAGVGILQYRYSEFGQFVDPETLDIFEDSFTTTGVAVGGVLLGGIRLPLGGDVYGVSFEGRYIFGAGDTGGIEAGFLDEKIDLSGMVFNVGFSVRF